MILLRLLSRLRFFLVPCLLASLPGSTNSIGGPRRRRVVKHSNTRGASSLGSISKLTQDYSVPVAKSTTPTLDSHSTAIVPSSFSLKYDKGIAYS